MAKDVSGLKVGDVVSYQTRGGNKEQSKVSEEDPTGFAVTMENGDIVTYLDPCSVVERANGEENTGDAEPVKPESEENYTPEGVKCLKCRKEIPGAAPQRQYHESCKLEIKRQKERERQREKNKGKKKLGEEFLCENCGETTIRKSGKHKYCEKCANGKEYNHKQQYLRKWRGNKNKVGERFQCPDCYKWVTRNSGAQKRCKTCARERENERSREYYRKHEEKKKQKNKTGDDTARHDLEYPAGGKTDYENERQMLGFENVTSAQPNELNCTHCHENTRADLARIYDNLLRAEDTGDEKVRRKHITRARVQVRKILKLHTQ